MGNNILDNLKALIRIGKIFGMNLIISLAYIRSWLSIKVFLHTQTILISSKMNRNPLLGYSELAHTKNIWYIL